MDRRILIKLRYSQEGWDPGRDAGNHLLLSKYAVLFPTTAFRRAAVQVFLRHVPSRILGTKGFRVFAGRYYHGITLLSVFSRLILIRIIETPFSSIFASLQSFVSSSDR